MFLENYVLMCNEVGTGFRLDRRVTFKYFLQKQKKSCFINVDLITFETLKWPLMSHGLMSTFFLCVCVCV